MRTVLSWLLLIAASTVWAASPLPPHAQWVFVPGARDLVQAGLWSCVPGVSMNGDTLAIVATTSYNTISNTTGPVLHPAGDFSVLADLSAPVSSGTFLTLVGTLATGSQFWQV